MSARIAFHYSQTVVLSPGIAEFSLSCFVGRGTAHIHTKQFIPSGFLPLLLTK
jgi:hypothetical protein